MQTCDMSSGPSTSLSSRTLEISSSSIPSICVSICEGSTTDLDLQGRDGGTGHLGSRDCKVQAVASHLSLAFRERAWRIGTEHHGTWQPELDTHGLEGLTICRRTGLHGFMRVGDLIFEPPLHLLLLGA